MLVTLTSLLMPLATPVPFAKCQSRSQSGELFTIKSLFSWFVLHVTQTIAAGSTSIPLAQYRSEGCIHLPIKAVEVYNTSLESNDLQQGYHLYNIHFPSI